MATFVLAPHLDDEIIGCYSVLPTVDYVLYFHKDYRAKDLAPNYYHVDLNRHGSDLISQGQVFTQGVGYNVVKSDDTVYLPSRYDYHPLHRKVRKFGLGLPGKKMFYSVEMNTPWLEEEFDPPGKKLLLTERYPGEVATLSKSDKYFLFKSIKPFDEVIWASVRFEWDSIHRWPDAPDQIAILRNLHRHKFYFQVDVQQFGEDRDIEYLMFQDEIKKWVKAQPWPEYTSCEMFASRIKYWLEHSLSGERLVRVSVYEDNENGCVLG